VISALRPCHRSVGRVVPLAGYARFVANPVAFQTLSQAVAEHLRLMIHRGEVGPGERLPSERELAGQLGVARMSLRAALTILKARGYVQVRWGAQGGTYVTELDVPAARWRARMRAESGEFDDIVDFRIALETESARLAADRRDEADLVALAEAISELQRASGRTAFRLADTRFHIALAGACRNARLGQAIEIARAELFATHDLLPFTAPIAESARDHHAIYQAVQHGDGERAALAMREHIENARAQLHAIVFGATSSPTPQPACHIETQHGRVPTVSAPTVP
jgi:GntR family transcriptional regulator, transcriptional repressor for pyruvate dehydrogenase complex